MDEIKRKPFLSFNFLGYYKHSGVAMPQRHYFNRFIKDFRNYTENYIDYAHFTVPLRTGVSGGYKFPAEYVG